MPELPINHLEAQGFTGGRDRLSCAHESTFPESHARAPAPFVLVPTTLLALKVFTGVGPSLPGPHVREVLGIVEPFAPVHGGPAE